MKKFLSILVVNLFIFNLAFSIERSKIEVKNGVFIEDVESFGTFNEINIAPHGMFKARHSQFTQMSKYDFKNNRFLEHYKCDVETGNIE